METKTRFFRDMYLQPYTTWHHYHLRHIHKTYDNKEKFNCDGDNVERKQVLSIIKTWTGELWS